MCALRSSFWKKVKSLAVLASGGAAAFATISLYKGNEKFYQEFFQPVAQFLLEPEDAHALAILAAKWRFLPQSKFEDEVLHVDLWGKRFINPVGIAAGFDKDGEAVSGLFKIGVGFVEVGSVTPLPQDGNPKPRIFRLEEDKAVINRCGFNSKGHKYVKTRLQYVDKKQGVLGVNLGKNKLSESTVSDYVQGVREFGQIADYLVINVSSPNTPGLRSYQKREALEELLDKVTEARRFLCREPVKDKSQYTEGRDEKHCDHHFKPHPPILVKIAPDLSMEEKRDIAKAITRKEKEIDGLIVSNTTISRPNHLQSKVKNEEGGLSGQPLRAMSTETIRDMYRLTCGKVPIIGVGGISSGDDAYEKIRAGASAVQLYTALIYNGPLVVDKIKQELRNCVIGDGYGNISEAVGADHRTSGS